MGSNNIQAVIDDCKKFVGQYIKNTRDDKIYVVVDAGTEGVTAHPTSGIGGHAEGPPVTITWRAVKKLYVLLVHLTDIDLKKGQAD